MLCCAMQSLFCAVYTLSCTVLWTSSELNCAPRVPFFLPRDTTLCLFQKANPACYAALCLCGAVVCCARTSHARARWNVSNTLPQLWQQTIMAIIIFNTTCLGFKKKEVTAQVDKFYYKGDRSSIYIEPLIRQAT